MAKKTSKPASVPDSLEFLLKDILEQIKTTCPDQKDVSYSKLVELFYKGIDLRQKLSENSASEGEPEVNYIVGLDQELI